MGGFIRNHFIEIVFIVTTLTIIYMYLEGIK